MRGDIVGLLDSIGALVVEYKYDAWSKPISTTGNLKDTLGKRNSFRYRGYVYDEETGLYYLRSRYYNPTAGRFVNADTDDAIRESVGATSDRNVYGYCDNNPIHRVDPIGTFGDTVFDVISLGASIVEVIRNPTDPWNWLGLAGDIIDLVPCVTGVGEITRAVKGGAKVVDDANDAIKAAKSIRLDHTRLSLSSVQIM